jgi:hypothetical protein
VRRQQCKRSAAPTNSDHPSSLIPAGGVQQKKRKKEQTDSVDKLARQYLNKYFDAPSPASSKPGKGQAAAARGGAGKGKAAAAAAAASQRAAMKRWFE